MGEATKWTLKVNTLKAIHIKLEVADKHKYIHAYIYIALPAVLFSIILFCLMGLVGFAF